MNKTLQTIQNGLNVLAGILFVVSAVLALYCLTQMFEHPRIFAFPLFINTIAAFLNYPAFRKLING